VEADLLATIAADPDDEAPRLVYADWLIARGDRRGELIALDHRERTAPGGLTDPDALAMLLRLGAEYGFPRLPDPDAELHAFAQVARDRYELAHGDRTYVLDGFSLAVDGAPPIVNRTSGLERRWSDKETTVILTIALAAIRAGASWVGVDIPPADEMRHHPAYRLGPWPRYFSAKVYEDFGADWLLRARDYDRWHTLYDRLVPLIR
jgi:uncharacterized protein (TIGR02996 family)